MLPSVLSDQFAANNQRMQVQCDNCGFGTLYVTPLGRCPQCGEDFLRMEYDLAGLKAAGWVEAMQKRPAMMGLWRYRELLPLRNEANIVTLGEGSTPLIHMKNLGALLGLKHLYFKDERQGPTNSFKDRQASVAISVMQEQGIREAVVASTGNVAIAYSAYAARAGLKLWAFFPSRVPNDKMREVALYGTEVIKVTGTYDATKAMAATFAERKGIYYDRGIKSLAAMESMKTMAFEIAEALGWRAPDWFIQGVSGGMGPIGVVKGFEEFLALGLVDKVPAIGLVQSSGCAPMVQAFNNGLPVAVPVENPSTIIATLATANPGRAYQILWDMMQRYGGAAASASDEEAFQTTKLLARTDGISVEPATAVGFAGLVKLVREGKIKPDEVVVFNCTGHTFPVEKAILGDRWAKQVDLSSVEKQERLPETSLLNSVQTLASNVRRVLIIEDNEDSARLLVRILQSSGNYKVHVARDGVEGLAMVRNVHPDLIISDLMMPGIDGFQVIESLRAEEDFHDIPVIVLTAKELTVQERSRLNSQVDSLLHKGSFLNEDLVQSILEALN
ncbi:MAG: threonine synthase [Anaerolineae bacterium]|nr:threonine synthase [Anaerolineae bacterium]